MSSCSHSCWGFDDDDDGDDADDGDVDDGVGTIIIRGEGACDEGSAMLCAMSACYGCVLGTGMVVENDGL